MSIQINNEKMMELIRAFYVLTGIRIVLFDDEYRELLSYPEEPCRFCRVMKQTPLIRQKCADSDKWAFERCKETQQLVIYHCHAGLVEAACPLLHNGELVGFIMFGQVTDQPVLNERFRTIINHCLSYRLEPESLRQCITDLQYKNKEQIHAAAKILEACTYYVLLNELVARRKQKFQQELDLYIEMHMAQGIRISSLCQALHLSRTHLYELCDQHFHMGVAGYIKQKRLVFAKKLLRETTLSVAEIATKTGFSDYNYFCRVFKKEAGISAKKFQMLAQME